MRTACSLLARVRCGAHQRKELERLCRYHAMLSLFATRAGWFNSLCFLFFGTGLGARVLYPLGRAFRDLLLKLPGIPFIDNLKSRAARQAH